MSSSSTKLITWQQYLSYTRLSLTFISSISNIVLPCIFSDFFPQHVPWKYLFQLPAKWQLHQRVLSGILKFTGMFLQVIEVGWFMGGSDMSLSLHFLFPQVRKFLMLRPVFLIISWWMFFSSLLAFDSSVSSSISVLLSLCGMCRWNEFTGF